MTRITRIVADQQVTLDDIQNIARDPRDLVDLLVRTAVETGKAYYGGTVSKVGATRIGVDTPLALYDDGAIFSREDTIEIDLISFLPTTGNRRIVAIVAQGSEVQDEIEERDFSVNVQNDLIQTEARPTATRLYRYATISTVAGASAPQPTRPAVDAALTVLAYVTLTSTEILTDGIEQIVENRIVALSTVVDRLSLTEDFQARTSPLVEGLLTDVARLSGLGKAAADKRLMSYLLETVARLEERADLGQDAAYSRTDFFLDGTDADTGHINYLAKVEEGVRFDDEARSTASLALQNPADGRFIVHPNGVLLPKYSSAALVSSWARDTEIAISNAGSQTVEYRKRTVSRSRIRFGDIFTVCSNNAWWQTGRFDWAKMTFEKDGETFQIVDFVNDGPNHYLFRIYKVWIDDYEEFYWDRIVSTASYTGNVASQTFLMPRAAWMTHVALGFSRLDTSGDVRVMVVKATEIGTPDPKNVLAEVLIPHADLKIFPAKTQVAIGPLALEGGVRYAIIVTTPANHWLAISEENKFSNGSYFVSTDGAWFMGDISRDLCFEILGAQFEAPRLVIDLADWDLSGGVAGLDLLLEKISPAPTSIHFEVRNAGPWVPLTQAGSDVNVFAGLPASLDARMVLQGTTELMPGIWLIPSKITKRRPRTTFAYISKVHTTPVNVDEVEVICLLENYQETPHNLGCQLRTGGSYTTLVNPSATVDEVQVNGSIKRRFTFTGLTPATTYKIQLNGATTSALSVFNVSAMTDIAYPA